MYGYMGLNRVIWGYMELDQVAEMLQQVTGMLQPFQANFAQDKVVTREMTSASQSLSCVRKRSEDACGVSDERCHSILHMTAWG